jgi:POT family proton-dependent oligopeptide transporter
MLRNHPRGLFVCFATELWERFSYYGMRALLVFYLMQHFLFSEQQSYPIYGAYTALVYMTPVLGGLIADRYLGARKAVTLGAVLLVLGHFGMVLEGAPATRHMIDGVAVITRDDTSLQIFYLSLALIITGVGFLKTNATALVGALYERNDPRRDAGFTIFYMGINIGGAAAPLLCGWVGQTYGWRYGFGIAGLGMLAGLFSFLRGQRHLLGHAEPPDPQWLRQRVIAGLNRETLIYAGAVGLVIAAWLVLNQRQIVGPMLSVFGAGTGLVVLYYAFARCTAVERDRLLVCATLLVFTIGFWAFYEQMGSSLNVFADRMVDRSVFGYEIPASMFQGLPSIFIILFAPLASSLWLHLGQRGRDPSAAIKFSLAITLIGLAFLVLSWGLDLTAAGEKVALGWFVLNFFLMTSGELCLAPVGMAMVTKLAPQRIVGVMTGAFFLAYSASSFISGLIAQLTAPNIPGQVPAHPGAALENYASVYTNLGLLALGIATVLFLLSPLLTRRMHAANDSKYAPNSPGTPSAQTTER